MLPYRIPRFAHIILKPTLACTAKCKTCSTRRVLHRQKKLEKRCTLSEWQRLFEDVNRMGLSKLTISGGEPTLYPHLMDLIREGKKYSWEISLNTNGSLVNPAMAEDLIASGLNSVCISLYSSKADNHDRLRNLPGLWSKAVQAAKMFAALRDTKYPDFRVVMQTIISRENYLDFVDLLRLAHRLKFCSLLFSYLEGDYTEKKYLLNTFELKEFKDRILPACIDHIRALPLDGRIRKTATAALASMYPFGPRTPDDYAAGIYRAAAPCLIPSFCSIVLANGDVHPCNIVEYTHKPVMGNIRHDSFHDIWRTPQWRQFRQNGFDMCRYCPVPEQVSIPLTRLPEHARIQYYFKHTALKALYPYVKRTVFTHGELLKRLRRSSKGHTERAGS